MQLAPIMQVQVFLKNVSRNPSPWRQKLPWVRGYFSYRLYNAFKLQYSFFQSSIEVTYVCMLVLSVFYFKGCFPVLRFFYVRVLDTHQ